MFASPEALVFGDLDLVSLTCGLTVFPVRRGGFGDRLVDILACTPNYGYGVEIWHLVVQALFNTPAHTDTHS